ncbi:MAG: hypothetical protein JSU66_15235 [Deltaproteobacteria bacterium]|nr:MAG: hypothetical protein JSU66_15235 [Deltaproteobacteria bacterium]
MRTPARAGIVAGLAALPLFAAAGAGAAEIDSVTPRAAPLRDSMGPMNAWVNARIREGVERANERDGACDADALYEQVRRAISFPFIGHRIAEELNEAEALDRRRVRFGESIYRDLGVFDAVSVHLKDLSAVIRLDDHLVGVDKLGHFFVEGWSYFEIAHRDRKGIATAMEWGERSERTYFGLHTTAIYSYADLSVNFEGLRFWLRLLGAERDPLERGYGFNRPYVTCSKRFVWFGKPRWRVRRRVKLSDYVTGAWDEGVNCSRYRNAEIAALVSQRIREREREDAADYQCPIEPGACVRAQARYGPHAPRLLHPRCAGVDVPPRPWWKLW